MSFTSIGDDVPAANKRSTEVVHRPWVILPIGKDGAVVGGGESGIDGNPLPHPAENKAMTSPIEASGNRIGTSSYSEPWETDPMPAVKSKRGRPLSACPARPHRGGEGWGCPEPHPRELMAAPSGLTRFTPSGRSGPHPSSPRCGVCSGLFLRLTPGEDARHEVQHVGRTRFIVAVVANQATLHHVDFFLRRPVDHVRHQARQLDRVLLVLEQLEFERLLQSLVGLVVELLAVDAPVPRCSS